MKPTWSSNCWDPRTGEEGPCARAEPPDLVRRVIGRDTAAALLQMINGRRARGHGRGARPWLPPEKAGTASVPDHGEGYGPPDHRLLRRRRPGQRPQFIVPAVQESSGPRTSPGARRSSSQAGLIAQELTRLPQGADEYRTTIGLGAPSLSPTRPPTPGPGQRRRTGAGPAPAPAPPPPAGAARRAGCARSQGGQSGRVPPLRVTSSLALALGAPWE